MLYMTREDEQKVRTMFDLINAYMDDPDAAFPVSGDGIRKDWQYRTALDNVCVNREGV